MTMPAPFVGLLAVKPETLYEPQAGWQVVRNWVITFQNIHPVFCGLYG
jgi:hypothetical protein